MIFQQTTLPGTYLIDLEYREDDRGFFARCFCEKEFSAKGLNTRWVQINNSLSKQVGTLRGLHFQQPPHDEIKLVRCLRGAIWDVVVDLRPDSPTFGKWFGATLSDENRTMIYVPQGCAHGFMSLKPDSEILYLVSHFYTPDAEKILLWNDPDLAIDWPMTPTVMSDKDRQGVRLGRLMPPGLMSQSKGRPC